MIQRRVAIVAVVVIVAAALALLIRPPIKEPGLSHQLIALQRAYESQTINFSGPGGRFSIDDIPDSFEDQLAQARDVDQENDAKLRALLDRYGWPTEKMVGREAVLAAMNVVRRSQDLGFKEFAIALMQRAGADDNESYARLVDMVAVMKGEPQTYGTEWTCADGYAKPATPVKDPNKALELRRKVGLPAYEKFASEFCIRQIGGEVTGGDYQIVVPVQPAGP